MVADLRLSDQGHGDSSDVQASAYKCLIKGQSVVGLSTADTNVWSHPVERPIDCALVVRIAIGWEWRRLQEGVEDLQVWTRKRTLWT